MHIIVKGPKAAELKRKLGDICDFSQSAESLLDFKAVNIVAPEKTPTGANVKNGVIQVSCALPTINEMAESVIFEAQNVENEESWQQHKDRLLNGAISLQEYGRLFAGTEQSSSKTLEKILLEIKRTLHKRNTPALYKVSRYGIGNTANACKSLTDFINAPHMPGNTGPAGLPSWQFYAYEIVDKRFKDRETIIENMATIRCRNKTFNGRDILNVFNSEAGNHQLYTSYVAFLERLHNHSDCNVDLRGKNLTECGYTTQMEHACTIPGGTNRQRALLFQAAVKKLEKEEGINFNVSW